MTQQFTKTGPESALAMFEAEAEGLAVLRKTATVRVPGVIDVGISKGKSFISLEKLDLGPATAETERKLGGQLAALHRHTAEKFGWHRDNTIGLTPQQNTPADDWVAFFCEHRIRYQLELASSKGFRGELADRGAELCDRLDKLFANHEPLPSLLHGDLWGGNWGSVDGEAVIFDPAVYYGDRESDIAMTMLFGGFGAAFYAAYTSSWPMSAGHEERIKLYQLYHVLNHVNLFGGGYLDQAIQLLRVLTRIV